MGEGMAQKSCFGDARQYYRLDAVAGYGVLVCKRNADMGWAGQVEEAARDIQRFDQSSSRRMIPHDIFCRNGSPDGRSDICLRCRTSHGNNPRHQRSKLGGADRNRSLLGCHCVNCKMGLDAKKTMVQDSRYIELLTSSTFH